MSTVRFARPAEFHKALYSRVRHHLKDASIPKDGGARIITKTALIFALFFGSYVGLVFWADTALSVMAMAFLLSQAIVLIGFNVMHDAGHGAFSSQRWVNRLVGLSLDLIGGSQWLWRHKHGVLHHRYTNLEAFDDDLDTGGLIRMHPDQDWSPVHRYQAFYAIPLYTMLYPLWVVKDVPEFIRRTIGRHDIGHAPSLKDTLLFFGFKANFVFWALVVPMTLHTWYVALLVFIGIQMVVSLILALVFQFAHVVDGVEMPSLSEGDLYGGAVEEQWALHQISTTANFAIHNPFVRWYAGGLNCQIEHHLFVGISHVRYPHVQPIVEQTCADFGVTYRTYPTVRAAFAAHMRQLVAMSRQPEVAPAPATAGTPTPA